MRDFKNYINEFPNKDGFFGTYGGSYLPEKLKVVFDNIAKGYEEIRKMPSFINELRYVRKHYQGRPTPIYYCKNLSEKLGGNCQIYLKREDLNHTGSHKINHCMGEGMLAKYLGKKKLIAETGAGSHGVALATVATYLGLECEIHMGEVDIEKQASNVTKMKILGAKIICVKDGLRTLKEAVDSAFNAYLKDYENSLYCIGSALGPHPFPMMVRDFQKVVGEEAREQFLDMTGELPDLLCACVGGGSNSIGLFFPFLADNVQLIGVEPLGKGEKNGENAASLIYGKEGILHGFKSYLIQSQNGEPAPVYSVASGLDYPSVGPEHAYLHDIGRVKYVGCSDKEAVEAFFMLSKYEGIIPALESSHALAFAIKLAREKQKKSILVNLSGRGDKDVDYIMSFSQKDEDYFNQCI